MLERILNLYGKREYDKIETQKIEKDLVETLVDVLDEEFRRIEEYMGITKTEDFRKIMIKYALHYKNHELEFVDGMVDDTKLSKDQQERLRELITCRKNAE